MPIERESSVLLSLNICSASSTDLNQYIIFLQLLATQRQERVEIGEDNSKKFRFCWQLRLCGPGVCRACTKWLLPTKFNMGGIKQINFMGHLGF